MITAFKDYQQLTHYVEISLEKSPVNYFENNVYQKQCSLSEKKKDAHKKEHPLSLYV